jgi:hypothetical protein
MRNGINELRGTNPLREIRALIREVKNISRNRNFWDEI